MELQWTLRVTTGGSERGCNRGEGTQGRGEALGSGTGQGVPSTQGKRAGVNSAKAGPSVHPTDNRTQRLLQLPAPSASGLKEQMPGSRLQGSNPTERQQQIVPKISCPAMTGKVIDGCS